MNAPDEFADVYDQHVWDVYGFFGYRLGSREAAEDLTQETFERALRSWSRYDERKASVRTWLLVIARNLLIDHHRRGGGVREEPLPEGDGGQARLGQVEPDERGLGLSPELEAAIGGLSDRDRELIALRYGGDLSAIEIARITDLTLANVQQILSRSLRRMRAQLEGGPLDSSEEPQAQPR